MHENYIKNGHRAAIEIERLFENDCSSLVSSQSCWECVMYLGSTAGAMDGSTTIHRKRRKRGTAPTETVCLFKIVDFKQIYQATNPSTTHITTNEFVLPLEWVKGGHFCSITIYKRLCCGWFRGSHFVSFSIDEKSQQNKPNPSIHLKAFAYTHTHTFKWIVK